MIAEFSACVVEGFIAPRRSARRIINAANGLETALLFVVLGYLITAIFMLLLGAPEKPGAWFTQRLIDAALAIALFFFMSGLIYTVGRASGGKGTRRETYIVVGWHSLVTSFLTPILVWMLLQGGLLSASTYEPMPPEDVSGSFILMMFSVVAIWFWLLASYIAELHRFQNTWGVLGVLVGIPFAAIMIMTMMMGAASLPH